MSQRLFRLLPAALVALFIPDLGFAAMSYSTYHETWPGNNNQTIYGYAELDDNGGCISGGFSQSTTVYSPTRSATSFGHNASLSYAAENGNWATVGSYQMQCNCGPGSHYFTMGSGVQTVISSFTANYQFNGMAGSLYRYTRCNTGPCLTLYTLAGGQPFVKWFVIRATQGGIVTVCAGSSPLTIPSCSS